MMKRFKAFLLVVCFFSLTIFVCPPSNGQADEIQKAVDEIVKVMEDVQGGKGDAFEEADSSKVTIASAGIVEKVTTDSITIKYPSGNTRSFIKDSKTSVCDSTATPISYNEIEEKVLVTIRWYAPVQDTANAIKKSANAVSIRNGGLAYEFISPSGQINLNPSLKDMSCSPQSK